MAIFVVVLGQMYHQFIKLSNKQSNCLKPGVQMLLIRSFTPPLPQNYHVYRVQRQSAFLQY